MTKVYAFASALDCRLLASISTLRSLSQTLAPRMVGYPHFHTGQNSQLNDPTGFIHVVNRPLAPPLTVFQSIFLLEQGFSTLVSSMQRDVR